MQLEIRSPNLFLNQRVREHASRRVHFAFSRFSTRIDRVVITVADINGPKGGLDKRCGVRVAGRDGWLVTVMDTDGQIEAAVSRAVSRASRAVSRQIDKQRRMVAVTPPTLRSTG